MTNNVPFLLSDESINSYGSIVKTDGIDITNFSSNPIMPFNHNIDNILGHWTKLKKADNKLSGVAVFDEGDADSVKIMKKVNKGLINGTSIGLNVLEFIRPKKGSDDPLVITKSELKEVSITPLPSNSNTLKLTYKNKEFIMNEDKTKEELILFLSEDNKETKETLEQLKSVETKDVHEADESNEEIAIPVEEVVEEKVEDKIEDEKSIIEELKLSYNFNSDLELSDNFKSLNSILELKEGEIVTLNSQISELGKKVKEFEQVKTLELIDNAIKNGKFSINQKATLIKLSENDYDSLVSLIETAKSVIKPKMSLSDKIGNTNKDEVREKWGIMDWLKNDPKGLDELKLNNRSLYDTMYKARYGDLNLKK